MRSVTVTAPAGISPGRVPVPPSRVVAVCGIAGVALPAVREVQPGRRLRVVTSLLRLVAAAAFVVVTACATSSVPPVPTGADGATDPVLVSGRQVYIDRCANCHGDAGAGGQGSVLADGKMVAQYPDIASQIAVVADGYRTMPGFAEALTPEQIEAVVRFTREVL